MDNREARLVLYEYPFNEGIRTMLRLEHLFNRLHTLIQREAALDHHFAIATLFEITDVAARADLKSDLLLELERHRSHLEGLRGNPQVAAPALDDILARIDDAHTALNEAHGKAGHHLNSNEFLLSIRSRIGIPAGTCEFDLPAYYRWQHLSTPQRQIDLAHWLEPLLPLARALKLLLTLLRDNGVPHLVVAERGVYQQSLPAGRSYHLLRLRIDPELDLVPEISGHRLMVSVRLMAVDGEGRLKPYAESANFELALCA